MKDNILPEEKLLNLIRGPRKHIANKPKPKDAHKISLHQFMLRYASFAYIRKIVILFFIVSCMYLIATLIYPSVVLKKVNFSAFLTHSSPELKMEIPGAETKPYEHYLENVKGHQIFISHSTIGKGEAAAPVDADSVKDINLVGIITGENPQAIIVDTKTQKTIYLNKGQSVGRFQVEDILEGKIILDSKEGKFELYL